MRKSKKYLFITTSALLIIIVGLILFISPLTKHLIEKYDEKYTGRQITLDRAYVNPFTGYFHFSNLKISEFKSDSVFISSNSININIAVLKLFSKTYEISELSFDHLRATIIQSEKKLNFSDLIEKFSSKDSLQKDKEPLHLNILNVKINEGEFYYHEKTIPINYSIKKVNFESTGKRWDIDTIAAKFSFLSGNGTGDVKGDLTVNVKNMDYRLATVIHNFDMNIIEQYLKVITNYGSFSATLDADMKSKGNFKDQGKVTNSGVLIINDFHFGKTPKEDYASFDKLVLAIKEISPNKYIYFYDSISLSKPYLKYEKYDHLDNIQTMFGKEGANYYNAKADKSKFNLVIEIANYLKIMSENFFKSHYKINRLGVYKADLKFNDYSTREKFSIALNPLYLTADSIDKNNKLVNFSLKSGIEPYGNTKIKVSINPKEENDFDVNYNIQNVPIAVFNPYIITKTSFSVDRGIIELNGHWKVRNGNIQSSNHLVIIDPRVNKRLKNKDAKWLPLRAIMFVVRERGNVIDYEIPISGNLKNPNFHLRDVIIDAIENIFVKPPTTPYRIEVKKLENEIEKSLTVTWEIRQNLIASDDEKVIKKMAKFLVKNPNAQITVHPQYYEIKEKEFILLFEAKKKYFLSQRNNNNNSLTKDDLNEIENMSVKDSLFISYLNKHTNSSMAFTIQEKCRKLIKTTIVNEIYKKLNRDRIEAFMFYFKDKHIDDRIKISAAKNIIPFNGLSFYKIEYKGGMPESLIQANERMNELNDESPRKKFKKDRKKNKKSLK